MSAQVGALQDNQVLTFDSAQYWQVYGLHQDPFAMDIDPRMYYASPHWEEYIDLLQYLCHYNNDLLVIAGVSGAGKTTLINEFMAQVDDTMRTCYATANSKFSSQQLMEILADGFDLAETSEEESVEEQLNAYLDEIQESDKICVLTIDNAHTLPAEVLRSLLHLVQEQSENHMRLHIILLGEPQLQMALLRIADAEGCERDQIHNLTLEPFSLDETRHYLQHRLTASGLTGEFPLSEDSVKRIYKLSEGIPGRINRITRRALLNEMPQSETSENPSWFSTNRYKLLGGITLAGAVIAAAALLNSANKEDGLVGEKAALPSIAFQSETAAPTPAAITQDAPATPAPMANEIAATSVTATPPDTAQAIQPTTASETSITVPVAKTMATTAKPSTTTATTPPSADASVSSSPLTDPAATAAAPMANETPATADSTKRNWQQNELHAITNSAQQKTSPSKAVTAPSQTATQNTAAATTETSVTEPSPTAQAPIEKSEAVTADTNTSPITTSETVEASSKPATSATSTKRVKKKTEPSLATAKTNASNDEDAIKFPKRAVTSSNSKPVSADERYLLELPASSYTLQLIGLSSAKTASKFIAQHNLTNKAFYFRTLLNGKPLFVLVFGNYASLQEANAALSSLPQVVQNLRPMPRSMRIIQETIKQGSIQKSSLEKSDSVKPTLPQASSPSNTGFRPTRNANSANSSNNDDIVLD